MVSDPSNTSSHQESLLIQATDEYSAAVESGEHPDVNTFAQRFPEISERIKRLFPVIYSLDSTTRPLTTTEHFVQPDDQLGDFRMVAEIGRGGMGIVYQAIEMSLGRHVAVKVLPFTTMLQEQQLTRFKNEAKAAASLNHSNIVPVYSIGVERGVHFYAMRWIRGASLAELIDELRERSEASKSDPSPKVSDTPSGLHKDERERAEQTRSEVDPLACIADQFTKMSAADFIRNVAQFGVQAANALDHAHVHGISHRDIKPANILIDLHHQLWLTDFGLAHIESEAGMTITGDLLGTVRYMSPEQISDNRPIDYRTDIYSLGISLYEFMALRPAFESNQRLLLLQEITDRQPLKLRKLAPHIPKDLETIIHKALCKDAGQRYDTMREFAEDLQRFLDNKPIHAKPPSITERASKWAMRHQSLVGATVVSMVITIAILTVSMIFTLQAYRAKDQQRIRAETVSTLARTVIDDTLGKELESLRDAPGATNEQREKLARYIDYLEQFPVEDQDHETKFKAIESRIRLGQCHHVLGHHEEALSTFSALVEPIQSLCKSFPDTRDFHIAHVAVHDNLGRVAQELGRFHTATQSLETAVALANKAAEQFPDDVEIRRLIVARVNLALTHQDLGAKKNSLQTALQELDSLHTRFPSDFVIGYQLARAHKQLAHVFQDYGRVKAAETEFRSAIDQLSKETQSASEKRTARFGLAKTQRELAELLQYAGQSKPANALFDSAMQILQKLSTNSPERIDYRSTLAQSFNDFGRQKLREAQYAEAENHFAESINILAHLVTAVDSVPKFEADLSRSLFDQAITLVKLKNFTEARNTTDRAISILESLTKRFPRNVEYALLHSQLLVHKGHFQGPEATIQSFLGAIGQCASLVETFPHRIDCQIELLNHRMRLGDIYLQLRKNRLAEEQYQQAILRSEQIAKLFPEVERNKETASQFSRSGYVSSKLGKFRDAIHWHEAAVNMYRTLSHSNADNQEFQANLSSNLKRLAYSHLSLGNYKKAEQHALESAQIAEQLCCDFPLDAEYPAKLTRRKSLLTTIYARQGRYTDAFTATKQQLEYRRLLDREFPSHHEKGTTPTGLLLLLANLSLEVQPPAYDDAVQFFHSAMDTCPDNAIATKRTIATQMLEVEILKHHDNSSSEVSDATIQSKIQDLISAHRHTKDKQYKSISNIVVLNSRLAGLCNRAGLRKDEQAFKFEFLQLAPKSPAEKISWAWHALLLPNLSNEEIGQVRSMAQSIIAETPDNATAWNIVGTTQFQLGDADLAVKSFGKLAQLTPTIGPMGELHWAMAHAQIGNRKEAQLHLDTACMRFYDSSLLSLIDLRRLKNKAIAFIHANKNLMEKGLL